MPVIFLASFVLTLLSLITNNDNALVFGLIMAVSGLYTLRDVLEN